MQYKFQTSAKMVSWTGVMDVHSQKLSQTAMIDIEEHFIPNHGGDPGKRERGRGINPPLP